jgi:hypothetical protein
MPPTMTETEAKQFPHLSDLVWGLSLPRTVEQPGRPRPDRNSIEWFEGHIEHSARRQNVDPKVLVAEIYTIMRRHITPKKAEEERSGRSSTTWRGS